MNDKATRLRVQLLAMTLLRREPLRSDMLAKHLDLQPRTTERLLSTLREVGHWFHLHAFEWWEIVTEVRGRERWHRLVDHRASSK
jgi:DNA-binding IclR family transcriptional regulator